MRFEKQPSAGCSFIKLLALLPFLFGFQLTTGKGASIMANISDQQTSQQAALQQTANLCCR